MQELNNEEMQEVSGGAWGKQKTIDFSKMTETNHYFYDKNKVTIRGNTISLKDESSRTKLTTSLGAKKVNIGTKAYFYTNSKGTTYPMIHVKIDGLGEGYIHKKFANLAK